MAVHTAQNYALSVADALLYCAAVAMFIPFLQSWRAQRSAAGLFDTLEERLQGLIAAALQTSKSSSNEAVFHSNLALRLEGMLEDARRQRNEEISSWHYWCLGWWSRGPRSYETLLEACSDGVNTLEALSYAAEAAEKARAAAQVPAEQPLAQPAAD